MRRKGGEGGGREGKRGNAKKGKEGGDREEGGGKRGNNRTKGRGGGRHLVTLQARAPLPYLLPRSPATLRHPFVPTPQLQLRRGSSWVGGASAPPMQLLPRLSCSHRCRSPAAATPLPQLLPPLRRPCRNSLARCSRLPPGREGGWGRQAEIGGKSSRREKK